MTADRRDPTNPYYKSRKYATAAIDLIRAEVLEEAARVAEDAMPMTQDSESDHYAAFCESIAAAIRALKGENNDV